MAPVEKRKRGRPSGASSRAKDASRSVNAEAQDDDVPRPRKRGRPSLNEKEARDRRNTTGKEGHPVKPRDRSAPVARRSGSSNGVPTERPQTATADEAADEEPPPSPPKPYRHIAPRTHRIRRSHIKSKWSPLDAACLAQTASILQLAHRPILQRLAGTSQRHLHTNSALQLIAKRITRRLEGGLPFPPSTQREVELSFEGVLDGKAALERQLDPALDAVELLRREKERIEVELEQDYETLRNLEVGARREARQKRELLKKAHALAPEKLRVKTEEADVVFKCDPDQAAGPVFASIDDPELKATALQLGGHLDSMATNLKQVDGIVDGISHSRAALQEALLRNLDLERYEQVILG